MIVFTLSLFTASLFIPLIPSETTRHIEVTNQRGQLLVTALRKFKSNNGALPTSLDDLVTTTGTACAMDTDSTSATYKQLRGWCGPYIDRMIVQDTNGFKTDGWGTAFQFSGSTLKSCGPDKTCGNADDLAFTGF